MNVRRLIIAASLLLAPQPALAQSAPFKLIIIYNSKSIAVADYPNKERCESAARSLTIWTAQRGSKNGTEYLPGGGVIITSGPTLEGICIPG